MKGKIGILLSVFILIALAVGTLHYTHSTSQRNLTFDRDTTCLGEFPIINGLITPSHSLTFLVDTGCGLSMITHETLDTLSKLGYRVDSTFCPVFYRDSRGNLHFTTKRYTVDLPINKWRVKVANDGTTYYYHDDRVVNVMRNLNFIPSIDNINILGLDLLKEFAIEYKVDFHAVRLYTEPPEDYEKLKSLKHHLSLYDFLGCNNRFFLHLAVSGHEEDFFIDTALDLIHVKKPLADTIDSHNEISDRYMIDAQGNVFMVKSASREWTTIGDRAGFTDVSYYSDGDYPYAINPFQFSTQDVLLDFPHHRICFHPHFDIPGYPGVGSSKGAEAK